MINYNTNQWLIVQYPCGAGGKFIASLMFMFDKVEHWYKIRDQESQLKFYINRHSSSDAWLEKEFNHDWGLHFFSRSYERNNHISADEFNQLADLHASQHFCEAWASQQIVVDHWHKPVLPEFWSQANSIIINPDDDELFKSLILKKLFCYDENTKTIRSLLDSPDLKKIPLSNLTQLEKFKNLYEFSYTDLDEFLEMFLSTKIWYSSWQNVDSYQSTWQFNLTDLLDFTKLCHRLEPIEEYFEQKLDRQHVFDFHKFWIENSFKTVDNSI